MVPDLQVVCLLVMFVCWQNIDRTLFKWQRVCKRLCQGQGRGQRQGRGQVSYREDDFRRPSFFVHQGLLRGKNNKVHLGILTPYGITSQTPYARWILNKANMVGIHMHFLTIARAVCASGPNPKGIWSRSSFNRIPFFQFHPSKVEPPLREKSNQTNTMVSM